MTFNGIHCNQTIEQMPIFHPFGIDYENQRSIAVCILRGLGNCSSSSRSLGGWTACSSQWSRRRNRQQPVGHFRSHWFQARLASCKLGWLIWWQSIVEELEHIRRGIAPWFCIRSHQFHNQCRHQLRIGKWLGPSTSRQYRKFHNWAPFSPMSRGIWWERSQHETFCKVLKGKGFWIWIEIVVWKFEIDKNVKNRSV